MPNNEFRLWEEDLLPEEGQAVASSSTKSLQLTDSQIEDDYYDDFVIVEKLNVQKYNVEKKLVEEEKIKDSGKSSCLVSKPGAEKSGKQLTLQDFKIIKVIDKGSFGKVFLVVNKVNQQLYAMKRINKDVLIDKNQIQNTKNEKEILF